MLHALSLGAPRTAASRPHRPHRHAAGGEENLREVVLFPMNQRAEDLLMGAPSEVTAKQLKSCTSGWNCRKITRSCPGAAQHEVMRCRPDLSKFLNS